MIDTPVDSAAADVRPITPQCGYEDAADCARNSLRFALQALDVLLDPAVAGMSRDHRAVIACAASQHAQSAASYLDKVDAAMFAEGRQTAAGAGAS